MEEVWNLSAPHHHNSATNNRTAATFILQDFLPPPFSTINHHIHIPTTTSSTPAPVMLNLNSGPDQLNFLGEDPTRKVCALDVHVLTSGESSSGLVVAGSVPASGGDRRHKRMIKNRESAARSRARKQIEQETFNIKKIGMSDYQEVEESPTVLHREVDNDIKIGTSFTTEKEAYDYYNTYAIGKGFSVRKDKIYRNKNGEIISRTYLCSKAGKSDAKSEHSLVVRTECKAFARFKIIDSIWVLSDFSNEHNHDMATDKEKHLLRSGRRIDAANASVISSMIDAGIGATQTFSYLANEMGGERKVQFTLEDLNNHIHTKRKTQLEAGDAQSLVNYFGMEHEKDPMFSYTVQLDSEGHMTNFFWRDGNSLIDYEFFGDVIIFDTTYRTNKYGLSCAPFTGINHHKKNLIFACAFMLDETTESFVWLFKTFLKEMGNRQPITIFTDQAPAIANAIKQVFPNTKHRLCIWHLVENAAKHLSHEYSIEGFKKVFTKCLYRCQTEIEFEETWKKMICDYHLEEHSWLSRLYDIRSKWCPAFSCDIFSAAVRSTQRSESTNSVFRKRSCKTMPLTRLVHHMQKVTERWRLKEEKMDFRSKMGKPLHAAQNSGILKQATQVYTIEIFNEFKQEFYDILHMMLKGVEINGNYYVYVIQEESHSSHFIVHYNYTTFDVSCSCKKFESMGILCCHALKVLNINGVNFIPSNYILKRWTKDVKREVRMAEDVELNNETRKSSVTLMRRTLMLKAIKLINHSVLDSTGIDIAQKHLASWMKEIESHVGNINLGGDNISSDSDNGTDDESDVQPLSQNIQVKNPKKKRPVGESNKRIKGALERKKKATTQGTCSVTIPDLNN